MTIAASSGLSEEEIENMVKQAEMNAEQDRQRRETIEMANRADSVVGDTEKALNDFKDQLDSAEADKLRNQLQTLREEAAKAQSGDATVSPDELKSKIDELQQSSLKLFEMVYKQVCKQDYKRIILHVVLMMCNINSVLLKVIVALVIVVALAVVEALVTPLKANSEMSMTTRIRNRLRICVCLFPMQCLQEVSLMYNYGTDAKVKRMLVNGVWE